MEIRAQVRVRVRGPHQNRRPSVRLTSEQLNASSFPEVLAAQIARRHELPPSELERCLEQGAFKVCGPEELCDNLSWKHPATATAPATSARASVGHCQDNERTRSRLDGDHHTFQRAWTKIQGTRIAEQSPADSCRCVGVLVVVVAEDTVSKTEPLAIPSTTFRSRTSKLSDTASRSACSVTGMR